MSTYYIPDGGGTALNKVGKAMCLERSFPSASFLLLQVLAELVFPIFLSLLSTMIQKFEVPKCHPKGNLHFTFQR